MQCNTARTIPEALTNYTTYLSLPGVNFTRITFDLKIKQKRPSDYSNL